MRHLLLAALLVAMTGCGSDTKPVVNSIGMRFVPIQAGTFTMGDAVDGPAHQVTLTKPFELGQHEVTQEQYEAVMGTTPSHFKGSQNPVEKVSWNDAVEFCRKLSAMPAEKKAGYVYRLPTEAEWEYACRAGTTTEYSFGDSESKLGEYAWYAKNSGHTTHPVGKKKPNAWGLYDMHGNVYEWCQDWYGDHPSGSVTDPTGAASGRGRVLRGGSFLSQTSDVRSASRAYLQPVISAVTYGFRVLRSSVESTESTNTATVELQDASRKEDDAPEAVTAKAGDTENTRRWYDMFVVSQDNQRALQSGTIKPREVVNIDLEAKNKRHIGFGTNVFQNDISFADGETIIFHQTKGAVAGIGVTSKDGNGGGQEFTPVDGQLSFQLENNSNHTLKYVIYEVVENEKAVLHPTSDNTTSSQSQTLDGVPVVNSIGMRFVPISAGTFTRGQGESAHKVTLTQSFELGQYEVTQEQYEKVMGKNPSGFKEATRPVETVNWNEAVEFCRKLSAMPQEKSAGFIYRLPTDAEWEYASRAGTTTGFSFGDDSAEMGNYGWLTSNSQETTRPVGQKKPNPWGLYDMYGNVWEWCLDWDGRRSSGRSVPVTDPTGPASGSLRVFRGGGWKSSSRNCRPENRGKLGEVYRGNTLGFRVIRTLARSVSKPTKAVAPVVNSIGMRFMPISIGTFTMGEGKTAHQVTLTKAFHLGQYEVTQEQYEKVMGNNPSKFKGKQNPVEMVSWHDAVEFCRKLSELPAEKSAGYVYRLPTEAEWEYACRAGTPTVFGFGDSEAELDEFGWYGNGKNSSGATVVGGKKPNSWGLYDMHGNVNEWCQDWYGSYPSGAVTDPTGPSSGSRRVTRGGSWLDSADSCRSARSGFDAASPDDQYISLGFRVVRSSVK